MYKKGLIQDNVRTESKTSSSTSNFTLNTGFLNGLMISAPDGVGTSTITIKYSPADGSKAIYMAQNHPLSDFEALSDQRGGHDYDVTKVLQQLITTGELTTGHTLDADAVAYGARSFQSNIKVNLGDLPLKGSELDVTINWKWSGGAINRTISISRFEEERNPARLFVYEQSNETSKVHHDVVEMYLLADTPGSDLDISIKVQDDFDSQDATYIQFHQMALTVGRYSSAPIGVVPVQIYGAVTPIPSTVDLNMSGANSGDVRVVVIKEVLVPSEVSASTIVEAERLAQMIRSLERKDPMKAQAYRHRIGLPKSSQLDSVVTRFNQ